MLTSACTRTFAHQSLSACLGAGMLSHKQPAALRGNMRCIQAAGAGCYRGKRTSTARRIVSMKDLLK